MLYVPLSPIKTLELVSQYHPSIRHTNFKWIPLYLSRHGTRNE